MSIEAVATSASTPRRLFRRSPFTSDPTQALSQLVTAILVVAYCGSLVVVRRPPDHYLTVWDGWIGNLASTLPCVPIAIRVRRSAVLRSAWTSIGIGIALNSGANLVYLFHDQNLHPIPSPAPSDAFYLASDLAFIIGVAIMTQRSFGKNHASVRLDGIITGLAVASAADLLWFEPVLKVSGDPLRVAVGMAYPVADLILLVLLVAGLAPQRYRPSWPVCCLMFGIVWFVAGDVIYLNQVAANAYVQDTPLDATWIIGVWMMAIAAWSREPSRKARYELISPGGVAIVPVLFGGLALATLVLALFRHASPVAFALAIAALAVVIVRMALTVHEVRREQRASGTHGQISSPGS